MTEVFILKLIFSIFLVNLVFRHGVRYGILSFQIVPQEQLRSHYKQAWLSSFWMLLSMFGLVLVWFPTILQSDFLSDPLPTLVVALMASIFLATALAQSAKDSSESVIFWRKLLDVVRREKKKDKKDG